MITPLLLSVDWRNCCLSGPGWIIALQSVVQESGLHHFDWSIIIHLVRVLESFIIAFISLPCFTFVCCWSQISEVEWTGYFGVPEMNPLNFYAIWGESNSTNCLACEKAIDVNKHEGEICIDWHWSTIYHATSEPVDTPLHFWLSYESLTALVPESSGSLEAPQMCEANQRSTVFEALSIHPGKRFDWILL